MKFVHIADMHFDIPFTSLDSKEDLGEKRRLEQRNAFRKVIEYVKENKIEYMFISGDFYEHEYVKKSTIDFIIKQFKEIENTKIFISPGNHDPYIKNSYYEKCDFGDNVHIFSNSNIDVVRFEDVDIYGQAFTEFYMKKSDIENLQDLDNNKINILVTHADLNGSVDNEGFSYNPILESKLNSLGYDYIALGHIHKNNLNSNTKSFYPGSTISLGFDELGDHGMIVGEITKYDLKVNFVRIDDRKYEVLDLRVDEFISKEDLLEKIISLDLNKDNIYKINLVGKRNFEINVSELLRVVSRNNVLKIKNLTTLNFDIEEMAKQKNLKGIFIKEVLNMYEKGLCTEEERDKAIEIGIDSM